MADLIDSGSGNSSTSGENPLENSPFAPLNEVISYEDLSKIFSGLGNGQGSGSPFSGSGNNGSDLLYSVDPFADENFWNIFAGGVNPSVVGSNQGSATDPLTGVGTTEIPNGSALKVTIDNLINSRLKEIPDNTQIPSFGTGGIPSFGTGGIPFA